MNTALNRVASEARMADMRRRAGRDAIVLATNGAANRVARRESASPLVSMIAAVLRLLRPRRIRRMLPRVIAADGDSAGTRSGAAEAVTEASGGLGAVEDRFDPLAEPAVPERRQPSSQPAP
jgi:hypothetical protein